MIIFLKNSNHLRESSNGMVVCLASCEALVSEKSSTPSQYAVPPEFPPPLSFDRRILDVPTINKVPGVCTSFNANLHAEVSLYLIFVASTALYRTPQVLKIAQKNEVVCRPRLLVACAGWDSDGAQR